eukprot:CAMPEP_0173150624 /NCGR_PEP_ID=MMETSP1105-20130129/11077_1 /TAXON_ID=2985 /ORGANISM="Ochromonas sp., Strain BG-1" /LENGTH=381 /DNA_ID=CAMNT_0014065807 /DNA_START=91 /DNA_END=1236 /DNA_ORIENTATION=+
MASFSTYATSSSYYRSLPDPGLSVDTKMYAPDTSFPGQHMNEFQFKSNFTPMPLNNRESGSPNFSMSSSPSSSPSMGSSLNPKSTSTLFVGDLSFLANEERLRELFSQYGRVESIHLKKSDLNHHRTHLSYGFVKFTNPEGAQIAYHALQGKMFLGRNIRLGFADDYHPSAHPHQPYTPSRQFHAGGGATTAQLYVTFASSNLYIPISELSLRELFSQFGKVTDVTIKQIEVNQEVGIQSGYGFVHFQLNEEGIRSAMLATEQVHNSMIQRVRYQCRLSHGLKKYLANLPPFMQRPIQPQQQHMDAPHPYYAQGPSSSLPFSAPKSFGGLSGIGISPSDEAKESLFAPPAYHHNFSQSQSGFPSGLGGAFNDEHFSLPLYL